MDFILFRWPKRRAFDLYFRGAVTSAKETFSRFWIEQPALFYGLFFVLGAAFALQFHWSYAIAAFALCLSSPKRICFALLSMIAIFSYTKCFYSFPGSFSGEGEFAIESISIHASPFQRSYLYKGMLKSFTSKEGKQWTRIPCSFFIPKNKPRPPANCNLRVKAELVEKGPRKYVLKKMTWETIEKTFSFAELRFQAKQKLQKILNRSIPSKQSRAFLTSMFTGEIEERVLSSEFRRLGLQHILGVSGFQFVLLASLLSFGLRWFLPFKIAHVCLILFLTFYYFFLGSSPPVERAWIALSVFLIGNLCNLRTTPLNALGAGLIFEVWKSPMSIGDIGFQLSFLCTMAILILYPLMRKWVRIVLPQRPLKEVSLMNRWNQHGYIASSLIRETLALNLAVHLFAIPALLFLFHKFPLTSFIYNLFFPFGAAVVFTLFLLALFFSLCLPPLGSLLHACNNFLTDGLLTFASHPPSILDFSIRIKAFPLQWCILLLTGLFFIAISRNQPNKHA